MKVSITDVATTMRTRSDVVETGGTKDAIDAFRAYMFGQVELPKADKPGTLFGAGTAVDVAITSHNLNLNRGILHGSVMHCSYGSDHNFFWMGVG